jgi:SAM-dependent methyltransferase
VNPRPTFEDNAIFYPEGYHENRDDEQHHKRYEIQFSYIEKLEARRVLDVGCARGDWLSFVKTKRPRAELHGVDAFSSGVKDRDITFHNCVLPEAKLPEAHFDLVTSWAVFEHLHTPTRYFETVARVLKPGGKFVFLVTNAESCYGRYAYAEDVPRHLYHFSERTLGMYAAKCGLTVDRTYYDDRLWDGRGHGTFGFAFGRLAGVDWEDHYFKRLSLLQRCVVSAGRLIDKIVFSTHWEAWLRRSGIIVSIMTK